MCSNDVGAPVDEEHYRSRLMEAFETGEGASRIPFVHITPPVKNVTMSEMRTGLGVDFGGVIHGVTYRPNQPDTFLEGDFEEAMGTPAMPGALETLARLVRVFEGRVWVVSKCGPRIQNLTENWLDRHDFAASTGIDSNHLVFCRQRSEKATRCGELGITHFVDDRSDVLEAMEGIVRHRIMFASRGGLAPAGASLANDWQEAEAQIMSTFGPVRRTSPAPRLGLWYRREDRHGNPIPEHFICNRVDRTV